MLWVDGYSDAVVVVLGLGRSGLATAQCLAQSGAHVTVWDDQETARLMVRGSRLKVTAPADIDWSKVHTLVMSPGIAPTHPVAQMARAAGVRVTGDLELFSESRAHLPHNKVVAIVGTNGKSTTTSLIGHLLYYAGREIVLGGNIGTPVLALAPLKKDGIYVLELSSFQLEYSQTFTPDVAVWLNLSPDHLDRHGDMETYYQVKKSMFDRMGPAHHAIICVDDEWGQRLAAELRQKDAGPHVETISLQNIAAVDVALPGPHNQQNIAAASAAVAALGVNAIDVIPALDSFKGLSHRMEVVAQTNGLIFVDDSKATNVDAAVKALGSFAHIYWIAGGDSKGQDLSPLARHMDHVEEAFFIGQSARELLQVAGDRIPCHLTTTLDSAVTTAANRAMTVAHEKDQKAVILLSPACASWDQFASFEARGDRFKSLVRAWIEQHPLRRHGDGR